MSERQGDIASRLRVVAAEARAMLAQLSARDQDADYGSLRSSMAAWIVSLDQIAREADDVDAPSELTVRGLLARALSGADVDVDGIDFSLHDITQLAAALRPGASLTVRNSDSLSPIEQTSIWTVMPGQVRFV